MSQVEVRRVAARAGEGAVAGRRALAPSVVVIVVATRDDTSYPLEALLDPFSRGAAGYVLNAATNDEAVSAVQRVLSAWSPLETPLPAHAIRPPAAVASHRRLIRPSTSRRGQTTRSWSAARP
jgi:DNA-binding NarL/FixJ family response regulator